MSLDLDTPPQPEGYLLLFRNKPTIYDGLTDAELEHALNLVNAWFQKLQDNGKLVGAKPLLERSVVVSGENGRSVTDAPFPEAKEAVGGYAMLNVDSMEEAVEIAQSNPMLKFGLVTEVRALANTCPGMYRMRQRLAAAAAA
jgi:hypothetical protein